MTIRWKKVAPILAVVMVVGLLPYINELFRPGYMSGIACVRPYPDGRVEKDWGDRCYDPMLPEAIVLKRR